MTNVRKRISILLATVLVVSLFVGSPTALVSASAEDNEPPVLVDAYPVKTEFNVDENVEYILIFNEPGGIDLDNVYPHFQLLGSPSPISTLLYLMPKIDDSGVKISNASKDELSEQQISNGFYAAKISVPVKTLDRDNFMSGDYILYALSCSDLTGNSSIYGNPTSNHGGGDPIPNKNGIDGLKFTVNNTGADLFAPIVKSIELSPSTVNVGQVLTITVKAESNDGVNADNFDYTLYLFDSVFPDIWYQYYPSVSDDFRDNIEADLEGDITTITATVTLPNYLPPGKYKIYQFYISDDRGNVNYNDNIYPIVDGLDEIYVTVENPDYTPPAIPKVTEFKILSDNIVRPGDSVRFKVGIESPDVGISEYANLYIFSDSNSSSNIDTPSLQRGEDGYYYCDYTIPTNLVHRQLKFEVGVQTEFDNFYQIQTLRNSEEEFPKLRVDSVFSGLNDITILKDSGSLQDLLSGVTAFNSLEGEMTSRIEIANPPDFSTTGVYLLRYEVVSNETDYSYIGYRWAGITDTLPSGEDDPFITTSEILNIEVNEENAVIMANLDGEGFEEIEFADEYTQPGYYKIIKNDFEEDQAIDNYDRMSFSTGITGVASIFMTGNNSAFTTDISNMLNNTGDNSSFVSTANKRELLCLILPSSDSQFTVTFDSCGGNEVEEILADDDALIGPPLAPERYGYSFDGWFKEESYVNEWDFDTDKVTANITLYAKWNRLTPPSAPVELTATPGDSEVVISWSIPLDSGDRPIMGYDIYRDGMKFNEEMVEELTFTDKGLTNDTTYSYAVVAVSAAGEGASSALVTATPKKPISSTLSDSKSGLTVAGNVHPDARLVISDITLGETELDEILDQPMHDEEFELLLELDISIVEGKYDGDLVLSIPIDTQYEGMKVLIYHWANDGLKTYTSIVENGKITFTATELSPFAFYLAEEKDTEEDKEVDEDEDADKETDEDTELDKDKDADKNTDEDTEVDVDKDTDEDENKDTDKETEEQTEDDINPKMGEKLNWLILWVSLSVAAMLAIATLILAPHRKRRRTE